MELFLKKKKYIIGTLYLMVICVLMDFGQEGAGTLRFDTAPRT